MRSRTHWICFGSRKPLPRPTSRPGGLQRREGREAMPCCCSSIVGRTLSSFVIVVRRRRPFIHLAAAIKKREHDGRTMAAASCSFIVAETGARAEAEKQWLGGKDRAEAGCCAQGLIGQVQSLRNRGARSRFFHGPNEAVERRMPWTQCAEIRPR